MALPYPARPCTVPLSFEQQLDAVADECALNPLPEFTCDVAVAFPGCNMHGPADLKPAQRRR